MARFALREFATPNYVDALPAHDPNDALWPRISMVAKMLNEIPWFKKGEEETPREAQDEDSTQYGEAQENSKAAEHATEQMKGYQPDGEDDGLLHIEDLDRDEVGFDSKNADKAGVKQMQQQLRDGGYDIKVDGVWGPKSQAAYEDYNRKLMGSKLWNQNYGDVVGQPDNSAFQSELDKANEEYGLTHTHNPGDPARPRGLVNGQDEAVQAAGDPTHFEKGANGDDEFVQYFHGGVPYSGYQEMLRNKYKIGG